MEQNSTQDAADVGEALNLVVMYPILDLLVYCLVFGKMMEGVVAALHLKANYGAVMKYLEHFAVGVVVGQHIVRSLHFDAASVKLMIPIVNTWFVNLDLG